MKRVPSRLFDFLQDVWDEATSGQKIDTLIVFEIGPGTGQITQVLLERLYNLKDVASEIFLILIEIDKAMVLELRTLLDQVHYSRGGSTEKQIIVRLENDNIQQKGAQNVLQNGAFGWKWQLGNINTILFNFDAVKFDYKGIVSKFASKGSAARVWTLGALPYNVSKKIIKKILHDASQLLCHGCDSRGAGRQAQRGGGGDVPQFSAGLPQSRLQWFSTYITQLEVAKAYTSTKGEFLGLMLQLYATRIEFVEKLSPKWFWPEPKVDSGIFRFQHKNLYALSFDCLQSYEKCIKKLFSYPRKTLAQTLKFIRSRKTKTDAICIPTYCKESLSDSPDAGSNTTIVAHKVLSRRAEELDIDTALSICNNIF